MKPWTCPKCGKVIPKQQGIGGHTRHCGTTQAELFWTKVDKSPGPDACWPWKGRTLNRSYHKYGRFDRTGPLAYAHRAAWLFTHGPIPQGLHVLHRCDVPNCCNPKHLWLGTRQDNMDDMRNKGRRAVGERTKRTVLNEEKVRAIRKLRSGGLNYAEIGRKLGCPPAAARNVCIGLFWKHVV